MFDFMFERESRGGAERIQNRLQALNCQHRAQRGARTHTNHEIMTWAEVGRPTDRATQTPRCILWFFKCTVFRFQVASYFFLWFVWMTIQIRICYGFYIFLELHAVPLTSTYLWRPLYRSLFFFLGLCCMHAKWCAFAYFPVFPKWKFALEIW